jgi:predicted naringenin-chalcone synthase
MINQTFISDFLEIKPPFAIAQEQILVWLIERHSAHTSIDRQRYLEKCFRYYGVKKDKISTRYFAIEDIKKIYDEDLKIYHKSHHDDIGYKSDFFANYTKDILQKFYETKSSLPEHMIHVTCTGYVSPSAPQFVVSQWHAPTKVTHAYHMGCYAALPAIRIADSLAKSGDSKKIDIVHTEACSLHMDPTSHTPEQIIIQTLFADGNIKYSLSQTKPPKPSYQILSQHEMIIPDSDQDMRWEVKKWGFAMTLSRSVPNKIKDALPNFLAMLANDVNMPLQLLLRQAIFAIHPGGPKIIEALAELFDLCEQQIYYSRKVLYERGNMSSATLPHVWREILDTPQDEGKLIVSLAFGPGLSIFGAIFKLRSMA